MERLLTVVPALLAKCCRKCRKGVQKVAPEGWTGLGCFAPCAVSGDLPVAEADKFAHHFFTIVAGFGAQVFFFVPCLALNIGR